MNAAPAYNWQLETIRYDRPHPRLRMMAHVLAGLPQRRLLDVGCSTARLRQLLPDDFEYFGCDVADHAGELLDAEHFRCLDLNRDPSLAAFAGRDINVVHLGGVLEYLQNPGRVLDEARRLVGAGGRLVASIINFEARRYEATTRHHPAWVFKPPLAELRQLVAASGWRIEQEQTFLGPRMWRNWLFQQSVKLCGVNHRWTRRRAEQFVLTATAR